jgi:hypothetical protein
MIFKDHGIPVINSRQWVTGLSPNASNTDWNFIAASYPGGPTPVEWVIIKNITTTPTEVIYTTPTHNYPNTVFSLNTAHGQLRAGNGRIFFPSFANYTSYYDPTTEQVHQIGPIVESPPINPHASTNLYSASFDTAGLLYMATQESQNRQAMVSVTDPSTLTQTVLGYVGSGGQAGTTYGYSIAPDTITSTKYVYVAYGEDPWQLWALNITPGPNYGTATKLYEDPATIFIAFKNIAGQGWVAQIDLGQHGEQWWWCLDGRKYPYTPGVAPPVAGRNVTPASNPLSSPPQIDDSRGIGSVGWRLHGSTGAYTYIPYTVTYTSPVEIESLVASNDGIVGNTQSYNGFFQFHEPADTHEWFGVYNVISRGPRLNINGLIYAAGYPDGVLISFDPNSAWNEISNVNPARLGYVGLQGTQYAGIKYATDMAWAPLAGASGRVYVAGFRERNGTGSGIGYWDHASQALAGTYTQLGMSVCLPDGLCVVSSMSSVVLSTHLITPSPSGNANANLYVFDYALNSVTILQPLKPLMGHSSLGHIFTTSAPNVITGIVQGSGNSLGLWQYNIQTQAPPTYTEVAITGTLGAFCQQPSGDVWIMSGNNLVHVDIDALTASVFQDCTSIAPVVRIGFAADGHTLFFAGAVNSGVNGAQLFSLRHLHH